MNALQRSKACEFSTSAWNSITCGLVISTTAQGLSVVDNYIAERAAGGCVETQEAPNVHR